MTADLQQPATVRPIVREYSHLLTELRTIARALLSAALAATFKEAQDPRFRNVPEVHGQYLRYEVLDAFTARQSIITDYLEAVSVRFQREGSAEPDTVIFAALTAEEDEIELSSALRRICARANGAHKEALTHLEVRLAELDTRVTNHVDRYSLHPSALCSPFREQIDQLPIQIKGKILLCELFARHLGERLEDLYRRANRILIEGGILHQPERLEHAATARNVVVRHPACDWTNNEALQDLRTTAFLAPIDADEWSRATDAMKSRMATTGELEQPGGDAEPAHAELSAAGEALPAGNSDEQLSPVRAQIIDALSSIQHAAGGKGEFLGAAQIKQAIVERVTLEGKQALFDLDADAGQTIDLVTHTYEESLDEDALPGATRSLLTALQIPVIKLALLDADFLDEPQHPARLLLNELASISVGISNTREALFRDLQQITLHVVDSFETDIAVFTEALANVRRTQQVETQRAREVEARARRQAEHKARRSAAKRLVVSTINRHIKNQRVPAEVMNFILKCWAPYMALTFLKEGTESQNWRWSSQVLRRLITATHPEVGKHEFHQLVGDVERFFDEIVEALEHVAFSETDHTELVAIAYDWFERRATIARARPEDSLSSVTKPLDTAAFGDALADPPQAQGDLLGILLECVPPEVTPGAWFEIFQGKSRSKRRLKMSGILRDTGHVLFANRVGDVVLQVHLESFLQDLRTGRSKLINDNKLFDRALTSVISSIRVNNQQRQQTA